MYDPNMPAPLPGQMQITGMSPGGFPAQTQGQRVGVPGGFGGGMIPQFGGNPGFNQPPAFSPPVQNVNALNGPTRVPAPEGSRANGGWHMPLGEGMTRGPIDIQAILEWARGLPSPQDYRSDGGFDRAGWQGARNDWMGSAPWRVPAPDAAQPQQSQAAGTPTPSAQPPMGMAGSSYRVQGANPSGSPFQLPTYNFGG